MAADECNLKRAALRGEWETITNFYNSQQQRSMLGNDVTRLVTLITGDNFLHMCAQSGRTDVMKELLRLMPRNVLRAKNLEGNTALHEAVRSGNVEMVEVVLDKEQGLLSSRNVHGETPIYWAAMYGHKEMLLFLSSIPMRRSTNKTTSTSSMDLRRNDGSTVLHAAVVGGFYDLAMEILELYPYLACSRNEEGATASHILALSPSSFKSGSMYSYQHVGASPFFSPEKNAIAIYACM